MSRWFDATTHHPDSAALIVRLSATSVAACVTSVTAPRRFALHSGANLLHRARRANDHAQDHCVGLRASRCRRHSQDQARYATGATAPRSGDRDHAFATSPGRAGIALSAMNNRRFPPPWTVEELDDHRQFTRPPHQPPCNSSCRAIAECLGRFAVAWRLRALLMAAGLQVSGDRPGNRHNRSGRFGGRAAARF